MFVGITKRKKMRKKCVYDDFDETENCNPNKQTQDLFVDTTKRKINAKQKKGFGSLETRDIFLPKSSILYLYFS